MQCPVIPINDQFFDFLLVYNSSSVHVAVSSILRRRANYCRYEEHFRGGHKHNTGELSINSASQAEQSRAGAVQCWVVLKHRQVNAGRQVHAGRQVMCARPYLQFKFKSNAANQM